MMRRTSLARYRLEDLMEEVIYYEANYTTPLTRIDLSRVDWAQAQASCLHAREVFFKIQNGHFIKPTYDRIANPDHWTWRITRGRLHGMRVVYLQAVFTDPETKRQIGARKAVSILDLLEQRRARVYTSPLRGARCGIIAEAIRFWKLEHPDWKEPGGEQAYRTLVKHYKCT